MDAAVVQSVKPSSGIANVAPVWALYALAADAIIPDRRSFSPAARSNRTRTPPDPPPGVLHRVGQDVRRDLPQPRRVGHCVQPVRPLDLDVEAGRSSLRPTILHDFPFRVHDVGFHAFDLELPRLRPGELLTSEPCIRSTAYARVARAGGVSRSVSDTDTSFAVWM